MPFVSCLPCALRDCVSATSRSLVCKQFLKNYTQTLEKSALTEFSAIGHGKMRTPPISQQNAAARPVWVDWHWKCRTRADPEIYDAVSSERADRWILLVVFWSAVKRANTFPVLASFWKAHLEEGLKCGCSCEKRSLRWSDSRSEVDWDWCITPRDESVTEWPVWHPRCCSAGWGVMTLHVTKCDISQLASPKTPSDTIIPLQPSIELCGLLRCTELSATAISSVPEKQI